ncbi:MAG TPA: hypothetical protein VN688_15240 [Gemmataceae bacterium]|nr:hypothetical protein [Gemmataceae bacterium]
MDSAAAKISFLDTGSVLRWRFFTLALTPDPWDCKYVQHIAQTLRRLARSGGKESLAGAAGWQRHPCRRCGLVGSRQ